ncbi:hypothetical protein [Flavobacterium sp. AG291]|uniref:hypothetical protein n=1 Tax=Flavobacterium sp. AG291 TaxID=2184000 RepID=UPI0011C01A58|nr:hypothetical protein [Flavobacterium sp. AG291]
MRREKKSEKTKSTTKVVVGKIKLRKSNNKMSPIPIVPLMKFIFSFNLEYKNRISKRIIIMLRFIKE